MYKLEVINELYLKATFDGRDNCEFYNRTGTMLAMTGYCRSEKMLIGPKNNGSLLDAAIGQIKRRLTGENVSLNVLKEVAPGTTIMFGCDERHVNLLTLGKGQILNVESENLLAFTSDCRYDVRFLAAGIVSQGGLFITTLQALKDNAQVAILSTGNPVQMFSKEMPTRIDPDALVAFVGKQDPSFKIDVNLKNLLGAAGSSGESYLLEFQPGVPVLIQANERQSSINVGIDGKGSDSSKKVQNSPTIKETAQDAGNMAEQLAGILNTIGGSR